MENATNDLSIQCQEDAKNSIELPKKSESKIALEPDGSMPKIKTNSMKNEWIDTGERKKWKKVCEKCKKIDWVLESPRKNRPQLCKKCGYEKIRVHHTAEDFVRKCPTCCAEIKHKTVAECRKSHKAKRVCRLCTNKKISISLSGREVSDEFRNKMSKITKGRKISEKQKQTLSNKAKERYSNPNYKERWLGINNPNFGKGIKGEKNPNFGKVGYKPTTEERIKISNRVKGANNPFYGKKHDGVTREKMRMAALKRFCNNGRSVGKNECEYLDGLSKEMGWNIRHAKNGGQYQVCGYSVDGYDETRNIIVEYDEPYHYTVEGKLKQKDIDRMNKIIHHTGCKFYRYNERTKELKQYEPNI